MVLFKPDSLSVAHGECDDRHHGCDLVVMSNQIDDMKLSELSTTG